MAGKGFPKHAALALALAGAGGPGLLVTTEAQAKDSTARAAEPWRLADAIAAPDWLSLRGEVRVRYETLSGQFRSGGSGGDQSIATRTLLLAEADLSGAGLEGWKLGVEVQDSRHVLDDAGTPLSTGMVNAADILQAYAEIDLDGAFGQPRASLKLGRQSLDIGSRRVLERVEMGNVILNFTGAYWRSVSTRGDEWHALFVSPVGRAREDRESLAENRQAFDSEEWGRRFWGVHHRRRDTFGAAMPDVWAEAFLYRLVERDTAGTPTPNRDFWQPGARLLRAPKEGLLDFDIEASARIGSRRATSAASDVRDLDVRAWTLHVDVGWTFRSEWNWRVCLEHDFASGDDNAADGTFGTYERLFGGRRTDFGNTGIYGLLGPTNISATGFRVEVTPTRDMDARAGWKAVWLDSATDTWIDARLRDPSGRSGRFVGHAFDSRLRQWIVRDSLRMEVGVSAFFPGRFARTAPTAPGQNQTLYGFLQLTKTL